MALLPASLPGLPRCAGPDAHGAEASARCRKPPLKWPWSPGGKLGGGGGGWLLGMLWAGALLLALGSLPDPDPLAFFTSKATCAQKVTGASCVWQAIWCLCCRHKPRPGTPLAHAKDKEGRHHHQRKR